MKKSQESLSRNYEVIKVKSDLKKICLKIINGFKSIFISFFTEIREMIRFMAN